MGRSGPRLPSPWWVLLPGVLLALAGARAVVAEMDRARDEARERARQGAERVARAIETLAEEYLAPLPAENGVLDAGGIDDATRHLFPPLVLRTDGGRMVVATAPEVDEETRERDAALAADARDGVAAEAAPDVAAPLLIAVAAAVETPEVAADLRLDAARLALAAGDPSTAVEQTGVLLTEDSWVRDGTERGLAAARLLADALDALARVPDAPGAPAWVSDVVALVASDPWGMEDAERNALVSSLLSALESGYDDAEGAKDRLDFVRRRVRELERAGWATDLVPWSGGAKMSHFGLMLLRRVRLRSGAAETPAWVGGDIPFFTWDRRVQAEMTAVRRDLGVEVDVTAPARSPAPDDVRARPSRTVDVVMATADVGAGYEVTARVPEHDSLPGPALALAAAVLVATLALAGGAVALHRAAREQARLAEERRAFLDHVAHEVRTPAAALLALSEELERGHVQPERQHTYHEHLVTEARRLADLVEETLDLTRLESGRLVAQREPADLREVVRDAIEAARPVDGAVRATVPDSAVPVLVDRAAVRRAIRNLVDNALKHGAAEKPVEVHLARDSVTAVLTVRDHGRGIPEGHLPRVFERFHRVPSPTHEVKGVGLGLALVREVAEMHGGSVHVDNAPGGGACFTLRLPTGGEEAA